ncbi:hypothetical protein ACFY2D_32815 [Streptomyces nigra]
MSEVIAGVEIPGTTAVAGATASYSRPPTPSRRVLVFGAMHAHRLGLLGF